MKSRNYHLRNPDKRSRFYRYVRDVPPDLQSVWGKKSEDFSLRVTDLVEARNLRDQWNRHFEREWSRLRTARALAGEERLMSEAEEWRKHFLRPKEPVNPPTGPLKNLLIPKGPFKDREPFEQPELQGLMTRVKALVDERLRPSERDNQIKRDAEFAWVLENTEEGRLASSYVAKFAGRHSYRDLGKLYLPKGRHKKSGKPLDSKTQAEYLRMYERADRYGLPPMDQVDWQTAASFLRRVAEEENAARKSLTNLKAALGNLWAYNGLPRSIWRGHDTSTEHVAREHAPWLDKELKMLLSASQGHWLQDVIWIGLYTGHRQAAIAKLGYLPDNDFIHFPALKGEASGRYLPCHPHIRESVIRFTSDPKSKTTIGNAFRKLRDRVGLKPGPLEPAKDFHSLRSNTTAQLQQKGASDNYINILLGRKNTSIATGTYGFKDLPPSAVDETRRWKPLVEMVDWTYLKER